MDTAYKEVERLLEQIRALNNSPVVERACDRLEVICRAHLPLPNDFLPNIHFTPAERRMLDLMRSRLGKTVHKDALLDAVEVMGREQPNPKTLDVLVCRIRSKFRRYNAPYYLETEHSIGFRLLEGARPDRYHNRPHDPTKFLMESRAA